MTLKIDLEGFSTKVDLLRVVVEKAKLSPATKDLDSFYDALVETNEEFHFVFINRAKLAEDVRVYFRMIEMAIEDAARKKKKISVKSYFYEEE